VRFSHSLRVFGKYLLLDVGKELALLRFLKSATVFCSYPTPRQSDGFSPSLGTPHGEEGVWVDHRKLGVSLHELDYGEVYLP
jgi:hypothetical protein